MNKTNISKIRRQAVCSRWQNSRLIGTRCTAKVACTVSVARRIRDYATRHKMKPADVLAIGIDRLEALEAEHSCMQS